MIKKQYANSNDKNTIKSNITENIINVTIEKYPRLINLYNLLN